MYTGTMIRRHRHLRAVRSLLSRNPVTAILGARQVGKTTLAKEARLSGREPAAWFDLEDTAHLARLADPMLALRELRGLVVIDEVQRLPGLFPVLRVLADRPGRPARFLLLGSASPDLKRQGSESLAGRIAHYVLPPLGLDEVGRSSLERLWMRGGFPRAFLARSEAASVEWRREFIAAFLERDLPQLGFGLPAPTPSWGELLGQAQKNFSIAWWLAVYPSLALFTSLVVLNLIGEGVREAFDPRK